MLEQLKLAEYKIQYMNAPKDDPMTHLKSICLYLSQLNNSLGQASKNIDKIIDKNAI